VAGSGPAGVDAGAYAGDGGPATQARLAEPNAVALDGRGDLYIADRDNYAVREVDRHGTISTIAGTGQPGPYVDGVRATDARLSDPEFVVVDDHGRVYFTDQSNQRVLMVDAGGRIATVAGNGRQGDTGDGGPATEAALNGPFGLALDPHGDLYVAENGGARVRMIDPNGTITTVAGTGVPGNAGDGGPATASQLFQPTALAIDAHGDLFIGDAIGAVRMVNPQGTITTVVGA
jgi:sugar lactone lactonase YvrE